ncbi:MMPL family transporter [Agromyces sp. SYSU K20354]|uniref:MMPL family transporter n=1 Tax=Agromyces cavernae TaxID=2898659 RepID=UPI001E32B9C5|nr:MMPL family transporter [Agromyces cavernae]MCD2442571.1 MMPL family transporter [Agromyces cavernae]
MNPDARGSGLAGAPRWLRIAGPVALILIWTVLFLVGGRMFSQLSELSTNDRVQFLPATAESTQVRDLQQQFALEGVTYAVVVFEADAPIDAFVESEIDRGVRRIEPIEGVRVFDATPVIVSDDRLAAELVIPVASVGEIDEAVTALRSRLADVAPDGLQVHVTGPAGFTSDIITAFQGIDGLLLLVALAAVLLVLVIVYRSVLLPLIVLVTSLSALCGAVLVVSALARSGVILLAGQTQGILLILVIGATTNYALLYISRYTEALARRGARWDATLEALKGSWQPILASGATVIVSLTVLLLSQLDSNRTLGPVAAIGIVFALLAAFTLLPVLLLWAGRAAFWPRRLKSVATDPTHADVLGGAGVWARLARRIARRPRAVWVVSTLVLAVMALGLTQLRADGSPSSEYVLGASPAREGLDVIAEHFPAGAGTPAVLVVGVDAILPATERALDVPGVDSVRIATLAGPAPITPDGVQPFAVGAGIAPAPIVVDDTVLLEVTLTSAADTPQAESTVRELRTALDDVDAGILVGGQTAIDVDGNAAATSDRTLIIPLVLLAVLLVLMVLLRALVAPLLLIASVALSYAAALGFSAIIFNTLFGFSGADPTVPLFAFVFLIALGVDYNIFLMTRAREEGARHGVRDGVLRGLVLTGGVITSAGVILAATFAALGVLPLLFLAQIAFIVAFGVLLDTFVVRTLLVPAAAYDLGPTIWWPGARSRTGFREPETESIVR